MKTKEEYIKEYGNFDRRKFVVVREPVDDTEVQFIDGYDCKQVDDFLDILIVENERLRMANIDNVAHFNMLKEDYDKLKNGQ